MPMDAAPSDCDCPSVQTAFAVPDGFVTDWSASSLARQAAARTEPISECKQADSAQGTAVSGSLKCTAARTAPNALFCIPTCSSVQHTSDASRSKANGIAAYWITSCGGLLHCKTPRCDIKGNKALLSARMHTEQCANAMHSKRTLASMQHTVLITVGN